MEEYVCKNSIDQKPLTIRLLDEQLEWQQGEDTGNIAYANIISVRLSKTGSQFKIKILTDYQGSLTLSNRFYLSVRQFEDRSRQYNTFVRVLHFHLKEKSEAVFLLGAAWVDMILPSKQYKAENIPLEYLP